MVYYFLEESKKGVEVVVKENIVNTSAFEPYSFTVERGKIREFVQAIGDPNSIYVDSNAAKGEGLKDITVPPTFPTVVECWGGPDPFELSEGMGYNLLKILHGEQEFEYFGEVNPGDVLTVTNKVVDITKKENKNGIMYIVTVENTITNQKAEKVIVAKTKIIERA